MKQLRRWLECSWKRTPCQYNRHLVCAYNQVYFETVKVAKKQYLTASIQSSLSSSGAFQGFPELITSWTFPGKKWLHLLGLKDVDKVLGQVCTTTSVLDPCLSWLMIASKGGIRLGWGSYQCLFARSSVPILP